MTHEEIEVYRRKLQAFQVRWREDLIRADCDPVEATQELQELALAVGASTRAACVNPVKGRPMAFDAGIADLVGNIQQALQTASMIDACTTAANNFKIAQEAQRQARTSQWIAFGAMLAAWVAAVATLIAAMAGRLH